MNRWAVVTRHATGDQLVEARARAVGRLARDRSWSLPKTGVSFGGEQERQRAVAVGQLVELDRVHRRVDLVVEVVDPELVEVAEDDVAGRPGRGGSSSRRPGGSAAARSSPRFFISISTTGFQT